MNASHVTGTDIARAVHLSARWVRRRAKYERWPYELRNVRGGKAHYYSVRCLPTDIVKALVSMEESRAVAERTTTDSVISDLVFKLEQCQRQQALHFADLLEALKRLGRG